MRSIELHLLPLTTRGPGVYQQRTLQGLSRRFSSATLNLTHFSYGCRLSTGESPSRSGTGGMSPMQWGESSKKTILGGPGSSGPNCADDPRVGI